MVVSSHAQDTQPPDFTLTLKSEEPEWWRGKPRIGKIGSRRCGCGKGYMMGRSYLGWVVDGPLNRIFNPMCHRGCCVVLAPLNR